MQKTALGRSFFVEYKFSHLADDNRGTACYDRTVTIANLCRAIGKERWL